MDGFPVVGVGRDIDRDPIVVACVSLVQLVIEGGGIIRGGKVSILKSLCFSIAA